MQFDIKTGLFHAEPIEDESRSLGLSEFHGEEGEIFSSANNTNAFRVSAVFACAKAIAETVSTLPLRLYKKSESGSTARQVAKDHYLTGFLNDAPSESMTWVQAFEALSMVQVLKGNSFAEITRRHGYVESFDPLDCPAISIQKTKAGRLKYGIYNPNGTTRNKNFGDIAHFKGVTFDGLQGVSPITYCNFTSRNAVAINKHGVNQLENGTKLSGVLKMPSTFKNVEDRNRVRNGWERMHAGADGKRVAILENGMEWQQLSMSMQDAQFIEQMQFSVEEIARIFAVPPHIIGHLARATNNNIEHQGKEFYGRTIRPWLTRNEQTLNQSLLTKAERREGYFFEFDPEAILSADFKTRTEGRQKQVLSGLMTINEARAKDRQEPIEGGDTTLVPLNYTTIENLNNSKINED